MAGEAGFLLVGCRMSQDEARLLSEGLERWRVLFGIGEGAAAFSGDVSVAGMPIIILAGSDAEAAAVVSVTESKGLADCHACVLGFGMDYRGNAGYVVLEAEGITDDYLDLVWARYAKKPLTILTTDRLVVREMTTDDLPELYRLYGYEHMTDFVEPLYEYGKELEFTENYIRDMYGFYGYGLWLVICREDGRLIGRAGLENRVIDGVQSVELGYMVGTPFQRMGYAGECCRGIIRWAFDRGHLGLDRLALCTSPGNIPSARLARSLGFRLHAQDVGGLDLYYLDRDGMPWA